MSKTAVPRSFVIRRVTQEDIAEVYKLLVANRPYVGLNSRYTYFLLAKDFADTCLVALDGGKIVGFASGVTLGLAFSFGGLVTPILGLAADQWGVSAAIAIIAALPIFCVALAFTYPVPEQVTKA